MKLFKYLSIASIDKLKYELYSQIAILINLPNYTSMQFHIVMNKSIFFNNSGFEHAYCSQIFSSQSEGFN